MLDTRPASPCPRRLGSATAELEEEERDAENWAVKAAEQATSAVVSCDWLRSLMRLTSTDAALVTQWCRITG